MFDLIKKLLIICPLVFLGGFVDAIAGGGGLITLPSYMLAGVPTHNTLATNKTAMSLGTLTASIKYLKSGNVNLKCALISAVGSLIGSAIGSKTALIIPADVLNLLMLVILPIVAVFLFIKKDLGSEIKKENNLPEKRFIIYTLIIGLIIGCYDGLIGPGTGTFLIIAFSSVLGFDLIESSGCAKIANLASNVTSMIIYLINGKVLFALAVPAAISAMAGNYIGSTVAIKGGNKYIRYTVFLVLGLLVCKIGYDFLIK